MKKKPQRIITLVFLASSFFFSAESKSETFFNEPEVKEVFCSEGYELYLGYEPKEDKLAIMLFDPSGIELLKNAQEESESEQAMPGANIYLVTSTFSDKGDKKVRYPNVIFDYTQSSSHGNFGSSVARTLREVKIQTSEDKFVECSLKKSRIGISETPEDHNSNRSEIKTFKQDDNASVVKDVNGSQQF